MITLAAMLSMIDGNTDYVNKYWDIITTWADYLVKNGQDPSNQLCTDDFAGHWAHNANLSVKAIMGVAGYAEMARMKGDDATADKYMQKAKEMGAIWEKTAREGNHYRLAFDRENTWSQKYNMVWDKLWNTNVFPKGTMEREMKSYLKLQNKYGLPLDCRKDYTKSTIPRATGLCGLLLWLRIRRLLISSWSQYIHISTKHSHVFLSATGATPRLVFRLVSRLVRLLADTG